MEINITDTYTEIYETGGGNFITQSYPTNFHSFWTRKMLAPGESITDFMEVTAAQKAAIEAADASWVRPSDSLIRRWNAAWRNMNSRCLLGKYNEKSGFFEGNGKVDITTEQAERILDYGTIRLSSENANVYIYDLPTLLPLIGGTQVSLSNAGSNLRVDTIRISDYYITNNGYNPDTSPIKVDNSKGFLMYAHVKHVLGILDVSIDTCPNTHFRTGFVYNDLETLWVKNLKNGINIKSLNNFRFDCLKYIVENAMDSQEQEIIVHSNLYSKLTDEENAEWNALLPLAAAKNITFTTP